MISILTVMSKPNCYLNPKSTFKSWARHHQTGCPHRVELPEIRLKYLNPSSLCLSCSHQESWLPPAAAAMWEELSTSKECPRPAKAESPSLPSSRSLPSSHMRTRRWLSPAGSPSMSWRSSSSCCPLQVCHINCVLISESAFLAIKTSSFIINWEKSFSVGLTLHILEAHRTSKTSKYGTNSSEFRHDLNTANDS